MFLQTRKIKYFLPNMLSTYGISSESFLILNMQSSCVKFAIRYDVAMVNIA